MNNSKRARQRQRQAENRQTRDIRKAIRRFGRQEMHIQTKINVETKMQFTYDATLSHVAPSYMDVKRHTGCDALVEQHEAIAHDDAMFANYKKITGQKSCLIYCRDTTDRMKSCDTELKDMTEVVFVVNIELYKDMDTTRRDHYQWMFDYLLHDAAIRPLIKSKSEGSSSGNHAMLGGAMKGMGWRAGYEHGYDIGTYAATPAAHKRIQGDQQFRDAFMEHSRDGALEFHKRMARNLYAMSPMLHYDRVCEAKGNAIPMFGYGTDKAFDATSSIDTTQPLPEDTLFSPHIIYTYDGFVNKPHRDNDKNIWACGIFAALDKTSGKLLDKHDTTGYHFYNASYGILLDTASCDGVVNVAWRGKLDVHGTTTGHFGGNTTRYAATSQLNKRTDEAVVRCMRTKTLRAKDEVARYSLGETYVTPNLALALK